MSEATTRSLPRPVRLAFALALTIYLAATVWLVWRTSILEPYSDMFDWVERWRRLQADGDVGRYLWAPHNFHHLVWTFVILGLDIRAFGAQSYLFLAVGVACLAATATMLAAAAASAAGRGLRLVGAGGAAALSAMGCHVLDVSADINTTYVHALVFAVAAILLAQGPARPSFSRGAAALACAVAAGLGSAAGLAVWPALLLAAWRERSRGWLSGVLATGAAFGLLYAVGQGSPNNTGVEAHLAPHLADAVLLFVNVLGLPWARGLPGIGWLVGLGMLIPALAAIAFKGGPDALWTERAAVSLILFSLTAAAMVGVARAGVISPDLAPIRYSVFLIPLHVGLWIVALPALRLAWERRPKAMAGAVAAAAALMLVHQGAMGAYAVRTADGALRLIADFRAGRRTPPMRVTIYPDLAKAQMLDAGMRRDGLFERELRPDPPSAP